MDSICQPIFLDQFIHNVFEAGRFVACASIDNIEATLTEEQQIVPRQTIDGFRGEGPRQRVVACCSVDD